MTSVVDKAGFQAVIAGLAGLQPTSVVWALDPRPMVSDIDRALVILQLFSIEGLAWDEYRREYGPPGYPPNAYVTTTLGNRTVRITIRAEAFDASVEAAEILDAIYTGMQSVDADLRLDAINLAFVDAQPAMFVSYEVDERKVNAAIRDFTFGGIAQKVVSVVIDGTIDPNNMPANPGDYISTVNGDNTIPGDFTP